MIIHNELIVIKLHWSLEEIKTRFTWIHTILYPAMYFHVHKGKKWIRKVIFYAILFALLVCAFLSGFPYAEKLRHRCQLESRLI